MQLFTQHSKRSMQGVTLIELLIALALSAILVTLATVPMSEITASSRHRAYMNELSTGIQFARYSALNARRQVVICPANAALTACGSDWDSHKLIFFETDGSSGFDPSAESPLRIIAKTPDDATLTRQGGTFIEFGASGRPSDSVNVLKLCPDLDNDALYRALEVKASGRIRAASDSDDDQVRDFDGVEISCS